jgi:hypothetical protein
MKQIDRRIQIFEGDLARLRRVKVGGYFAKRELSRRIAEVEEAIKILKGGK